MVRCSGVMFVNSGDVLVPGCLYTEALMDCQHEFPIGATHLFTADVKHLFLDPQTFSTQTLPYRLRDRSTGSTSLKVGHDGLFGKKWGNFRIHFYEL